MFRRREGKSACDGVLPSNVHSLIKSEAPSERATAPKGKCVKETDLKIECASTESRRTLDCVQVHISAECLVGVCTCNKYPSGDVLG